MFELIVLLCRYLFIFYQVYFLILSVQYILNERRIMDFDPRHIVYKQRINILLMHIVGFLILSYRGEGFSLESFDYDKLLAGLGGLVFLIYGFYASGKVFKRNCPLLFNCMFFLLDISLIVLLRLWPDFAYRQLIWMFIGVFAMLMIPLALKIIPAFEKLKWLYFGISLLLLTLTFIFGEEAFGALRTISIGAFNMQPSELVKFFYVFYLASALRKDMTLKMLVMPSIISATFILFLVMQRDLGSALIFFMTYMMVLYISTGRVSLFILGMVALSGASVVAYQIFHHVQVRVAIFIDPWSDFFGTGHQIAHSLFSLGTFGLFGSGLGRGMPYRVPLAENDFIFSAICEEFGIIFGFGIIAIFLLMFYRGVNISLRCDKKYHSLLASGVTAMLVFQTFLIIGGVTKFMPLTGVTLPFVSYGGSSLVVCILMVGILEWIFCNFSKEKEELETEAEA